MHERSQSPAQDNGAAPAPGNKCTHTSDPADDAVFVKTTKTTSKSRPKARDYDGDAQEMISIANQHFCCLLSTKNAFPDTAAELNFLAKVWQVAHVEAGIPARRLTPDIARVVSTTQIIYIRYLLLTITILDSQLWPTDSW